MYFEKIKKNPILTLFFILVILMFGAFHIVNITEHGYDLYNPVPMQNGYISNLDEAHYLAGFRDVIDGHLIVKSPQLLEYKNTTNQVDILPYLALGLPAAMFGMSVKEILIVSDFIFPAIGFIFLYLLMRKVFKIRKDLSLLTSLLITIFQTFTGFVLGIISFNSIDFTRAVDALGQSKIYAPEFVIIPFLLSIITLYYSFKTPGYFYPTLTIILGVILVYSYIFYSTFFWLTFVLMSLYILYANKNDIMPHLKKILFIFIPAAILSIPWVLEFLAFRNLEAYSEIMLRAGLETGRFIHLPLIWAGISVVFLIVTYTLMHRKDKFKFWFTASMLISTILLSNMQIITGFNIQPFHWTYRISEMLYFILAAYILQEGYKYLKHHHEIGALTWLGKIVKPIFGFITNKRIVVILIIFFTIYGFGYSIAAANNTKDIYSFEQSELELYDWLNQNTPKDSVILTLSVDQNVKITTYTHNNIYLAGGLFSTWTSNEIQDRIAFLHNIYHVPESELLIKLNQDNDAYRKQYLDMLYQGKRFSLYDFEKYILVYYPFSWQFFYGHWDYQEQNPDIPGAMGYYFPIKFRNQIMDKFHNKTYETYTHDYLIIGPYESQIANIELLKNGYESIYSNHQFEVFIIS